MEPRTYILLVLASACPSAASLLGALKSAKAGLEILKARRTRGQRESRAVIFGTDWFPPMMKCRATRQRNKVRVRFSERDRRSTLRGKCIHGCSRPSASSASRASRRTQLTLWWNTFPTEIIPQSRASGQNW